ncbi:TPA: papG chaperone-binding domain protein [Yersinia enterocolitica]|nr:papG chaperone-binding domain protein [Yersinia enterocolitica]
MRFLILFVLMLYQLMTPVNAVSNNTFSFFWTSQNPHMVGNVNYDGEALSSILANVDNIIPGPLQVTARSCRSLIVDLWTHVDAYDYWIFVPKSVTTANGENITIDIHQLPKEFSIIEENSQQYILYKGIPERQKTAYKRCYNIGETYNFTEPWETAFTLRLDTQNLGVGQYTGEIPIKIAFAEYFKATSGSGANQYPFERWTLNDAKNNIREVILPFNINIKNKCSFSPSEINLVHGGHSITTADGHTTSQLVYIRCTNPGDVKFNLTLKSLNPPTTSYTDGVGVGLGNGWNSVLKVENTNISTTSPTTEITIPSNSSLNIQSVLKKTANSQPGNLSGAAVLEISLP